MHKNTIIAPFLCEIDKKESSMSPITTPNDTRIDPNSAITAQTPVGTLTPAAFAQAVNAQRTPTSRSTSSAPFTLASATVAQENKTLPADLSGAAPTTTLTIPAEPKTQLANSGVVIATDVALILTAAYLIINGNPFISKEQKKKEREALGAAAMRVYDDAKRKGQNAKDAVQALVEEEIKKITHKIVEFRRKATGSGEPPRMPRSTGDNERESCTIKGDINVVSPQGGGSYIVNYDITVTSKGTSRNPVMTTSASMLSLNRPYDLGLASNKPNSNVATLKSSYPLNRHIDMAFSGYCYFAEGMMPATKGKINFRGDGVEDASIHPKNAGFRVVKN